jgi:hypothetical protein
MDDREYLQLQIEIKKCFSNNKSSSTGLQTQRNTTINVLTTFSNHFRGEIFLLSLFELAHSAGICVSKERPISRNQNKTEKEKHTTNKKYLQRVYGSIIRQSTFLELGHSPGRCLAVPLNSASKRNWDPIS